MISSIPCSTSWATEDRVPTLVPFGRSNMTSTQICLEDDQFGLIGYRSAATNPSTAATLQRQKELLSQARLESALREEALLIACARALIKRRTMTEMQLNKTTAFHERAASIAKLRGHGGLLGRYDTYCRACNDIMYLSEGTLAFSQPPHLSQPPNLTQPPNLSQLPNLSQSEMQAKARSKAAAELKTSQVAQALAKLVIAKRETRNQKLLSHINTRATSLCTSAVSAYPPAPRKPYRHSTIIVPDSRELRSQFPFSGGPQQQIRDRTNASLKSLARKRAAAGLQQSATIVSLRAESPRCLVKDATATRTLAWAKAAVEGRRQAQEWARRKLQTLSHVRSSV